MSAVTWPLQRAVLLRARIPVWAALCPGTPNARRAAALRAPTSVVHPGDPGASGRGASGRDPGASGRDPGLSGRGARRARGASPRHPEPALFGFEVDVLHHDLVWSILFFAERYVGDQIISPTSPVGDWRSGYEHQKGASFRDLANFLYRSSVLWRALDTHFL